MDKERLEAGLSAPTKENRLEALRNLMALYGDGTLERPAMTDYVNNHIHTIYSFSPYSPVGAAYTAWKNGLSTAGIMDHDSVAGAEEFTEAGEIIGIATTAGFECRCKMDGTPFAGRRVNNPDQISVAYVAAHGIPRRSTETAQRWLAPYRRARDIRNQRMVDNINCLIRREGLSLNYEADVLPISCHAEGGGVTERHILFALAHKLIARAGEGQPMLDLLSGLRMEVAGKNRELLLRSHDPMYAYYLLGVLKSSMVEQFYINADGECPEIGEFIAFTREIGAISAYAYLGDVGDSVTGDKKTQAFEDAYLDELIAWLAQTGFNAVTYMPTRNTPEQLQRLMGLCSKHDLFEISGEDINTPFQSFLCKALDDPMYRHLIDATWALIGHERLADKSEIDGMFTGETRIKFPRLSDRVQRYAAFARKK